MNILLKKLYIDRKDIVTSDALKKYCKIFKLRYDTTLRYMMSKGYLVRIFRGIFYIRTLDELKMNRTKYNPLELVAKGMEAKNVKNWYFGLYTALKYNNMTHEYFTVDYVINDRIFRPNPVKIAGMRFKFVKISPSLLSFGMLKNGLIYSDPEKTILDFMYLWRYNGISKEKIIADISDWTNNISGKKINDYAVKYPKSVRNIVSGVLG
jgi:predicted transcriptional regulator of viral defense system